MISDIIMLYSYYEVGSYFYFKWNMAFILTCVLIQIALFLNNRGFKITSRDTIVEVLYVITFLKPAIDSFR